MTFPWLMLAEAEVEVRDALSPWASISPEMRGRLVPFGILGVLILVFAIWVAFFRKAKKKRKRIHRPHNWEVDPNRRSERHRHHHRRQRKSSAELPVNPTLAETGGMPPVRPADPFEPPDSTR